MTREILNNHGLSAVQAPPERTETECCRPEKPLCRREQKSPYLFVSVPGLIYQFLQRQDGSLSFLFLSASVQDFFEVDGREMESDTETLISMIHPDDRPEFYDSISNAGDCLEVWRWVGRFILPSGQMKWIQWDAQPSLQANGNIFWNGLLVDVTSQQQLQAEVERLSFLLNLTELLQSSSNLNEIAEFALEYLAKVTNSASGNVQVIDGGEDCQACPLSNLIAAEFVASNCETAGITQPVQHRGIPKSQALFWQVVETAQPTFIKDCPPHLNAVAEFHQAPTGQIGIFPIPATDGTVIGVIALESPDFQRIQDASQQDLVQAACRILGARIERAKAQERLYQTNAQLQCTSQQLRQQAQHLEQTFHELQQAQTQLVHSEKMSSLGHLVAGIAHKINNPINFIQGNLPHARRYFQDMLYLLELYRQHYPQPVSDIQLTIKQIDLDFLIQDLPKLLSSMQAGAERIHSIVRSLRNFSRLDEAEKKVADIHEGIDGTIMILEHRLKAQPDRPAIQVIKEYGNLPCMECYAGQLNQVFLNILSNAIDALDESFAGGYLSKSNNKASMTKNTGYIKICTQLLENSRIIIRIADNGIGIPASVQTRLFDPFFTTKPVGKGTGLGLSISFQIITEKHGGQLRCVSTPLQGTEFLIEIPMQPVKLSARVSEESSISL
ncbi:ATP-binding protein [Microcoleus sp. FACHB-672]|uniref:GAF domain-containing sensor histidine kinase n=1 Tax=Microcoleus sp. FACHB-672 TaxID=2692825 RepID=UPI001687837A|nr:ATP-binding protein [Microcoleus sp. FACHB-672]MBD2041582.1 PAS domain-containing protein [Microcoleus sp. FACHB-672]